MRTKSAVAARLRTMLTITVTAVLAGVISATPASAHTALQSASPADGTTVKPPTQVVLTYADPVQFTQVVVTDTAGRQYQSGKPVNVDNTVTENLSATPPNGRYTVAWRVVAPDGHPVEGTYKFTVTGSGATAPAAAPAATGRPAGSSSGTSLWWIVLIVLLIAAAAVGGVLLLRKSATDPDADPDADPDDGPDDGPDDDSDAASDSGADSGAAAGGDTGAGAGRQDR
jgi:methionine-rich copper-binding protein CopC